MSTYAYLCPTPKQHCRGSNGSYSAALDKQHIKKHGSPEEAMKCYGLYLVGVLGYTKVSSREFKPADGGPIMILSKPRSFGARLRTGKAGEGSSAAANRGMPSIRHGGVIIST